MFKDFYSFSEDPFTLEPDPRFFFLTENHRKVLFSLIYGITETKGFTLLLGETGTGKTTFIRHLLSMLGPQIKAIPIFAPPKTLDELLEVILRELKLPLQEGNGNSRLRQINEYLNQRSNQNVTLLIIVDEAQNLSKELLEQLRLICNPDPIRQRLFFQGFLVGKPDIADKLDSWDLRALKQRIVIRRRLRPLTEEESRRYIEYRLKEVGSSLEAIFTPEAADLICRHSRGIPRVIHMLCYLALSIGYVLSQKKIDAPLMKRILPLLDTQKPSVRQPVESLARTFIDCLANSPWIMRISYALRSENKFKTLVENIPLKMYIKDRGSVYVFCNEKYAADLKMKAEDIAGKTDYQLFPAELAQKYVSDDKRIMATGQVENIEEEYVHEGQPLIVHTVKKPLKDERGETVGILGVFWDITEQKRKEDELKRHFADLEELVLNRGAELERVDTQLQREVTHHRRVRQELQEIRDMCWTFFENAEIASVVVEENLIISSANREFEKLSGYPRVEVEWEKSLSEFLTPDVFEKIKELCFAGITTLDNVLSDYECQFMGHGGNRKDVRITAARVPGAQKGMVSLLDITDRKRVEEALYDLKEKNEALVENISDAILVVQDGLLKCGNDWVEKELSDSIEPLRGLLIVLKKIIIILNEK